MTCGSVVATFQTPIAVAIDAGGSTAAASAQSAVTKPPQAAPANAAAT
jgi:hypothetical protein